jgi:hypothetical protein
MNTAELSDATLDCWVERAEMLRLNPDASVADVVHCQRFTTDPDLAELIIKRELIVVEELDDPYRGSKFLAYRPLANPGSPLVDDRKWHGDTALDAAMLCYIVSVFGEEVELKLLWENGEPRYQPYE